MVENTKIQSSMKLINEILKKMEIEKLRIFFFLIKYQELSTIGDYFFKKFKNKFEKLDKSFKI